MAEQRMAWPWPPCPSHPLSLSLSSSSMNDSLFLAESPSIFQHVDRDRRGRPRPPVGRSVEWSCSVTLRAMRKLVPFRVFPLPPSLSPFG